VSEATRLALLYSSSSSSIFYHQDTTNHKWLHALTSTVARPQEV